MAIVTECVEGERFGINLSYKYRPSPEKLIHPSYSEILDSLSISVGRVVPFSEAGFIAVPIVTHSTHALEVREKTEARTIDVLELLPPQWRILTVEFPREFFMISKLLGQDMESPDERWRLERRMPLVVFGDNRIITLPVYRVKREERAGIDETAEQIIHNVGASHAIANGLSNQRAVFREGLQYLRNTFGGPLRMDQVR